MIFGFPASSLVENANVNKRADWSRTESPLVIQRHNEIGDLEAELLDTVYPDEPTLQPFTWEEINRGANTAQGACLDVQCCGFWERQRVTFFDIQVCYPNANSYKNWVQSKSTNCMEMKRREIKFWTIPIMIFLHIFIYLYLVFFINKSTLLFQMIQTFLSLF